MESQPDPDCGLIDSQLDAWLAGRLAGAPRSSFERHLAICLECRLDADAARLVRSVLGRVPRKELLRSLREERPAEGR